LSLLEELSFLLSSDQSLLCCPCLLLGPPFLLTSNFVSSLDFDKSLAFSLRSLPENHLLVLKLLSLFFFNLPLEFEHKLPFALLVEFYSSHTFFLLLL
jgi:hypothetical protein